MKKEMINKFAIMIVLMIVIPEVAGHVLFERAHPSDSSVRAAVLLTSNLRDGTGATGICHLAIQNDPYDSHITRVAGLEGKFGNFTCI